MKKRILYSVVAVLIILLGWYFLQPSRTPAPQPPLEALSTQDFSDFTTAFNKDRMEVRLVLLLSPT